MQQDRVLAMWLPSPIPSRTGYRLDLCEVEEQRSILRSSRTQLNYSMSEKNKNKFDS